MYKHRLATADDIERIIEMGQKFHEAHVEPMLPIPYDHDSAILAALHMIEEGLLVVTEYVLTEDQEVGEVVGMLGAEYFQYKFNLHYKFCKEVMFWLEPEHRGKSLALEMIAVHGIGAGADDVDFSSMVALASSPESAEGLYKALGFQQVESTWIKKLGKK